MEKTVLEIISELNIKKVYSDIHGCMVDVEINQDHRNIFYTIWLDPKNRVYRLTENGYLYHEHKGCLIWPSAAREDWQEFYESKQPKEAVNARSQDEWNFVSQHLKRKWEGESFNIFNEDSCLDLHKKDM